MFFLHEPQNTSRFTKVDGRSSLKLQFEYVHARHPCASLQVLLHSAILSSSTWPCCATVGDLETSKTNTTTHAHTNIDLKGAILLQPALLLSPPSLQAVVKFQTTVVHTSDSIHQPFPVIRKHLHNVSRLTISSK